MSAAGRQAIHEVPQCETAAGHDQCPRDFLRPDPGMLQALDAGGTEGMLIKIVAGYNPDNGTFSRTRCSFQTNQFLEFGWAHVSGRKSSRWFRDLANDLPEVAAYAFGPDIVQYMQTQAFADELHSAFRGKTRMPSGWDWLSAGWAQICGRADVQRWYTRKWHAAYAQSAVNWARGANMRDMRYLALAVRMSNSAPAYMSTIREAWTQSGGNAAQAFEIAAAKYIADRSGSTRPGRVEMIKKIIPAGTPIDSWPDPDQVPWPKTESSLVANAGQGASNANTEPPDAAASGSSSTVWLVAGAVAAVAGWFAYKRGLIG